MCILHMQRLSSLSLHTYMCIHVHIAERLSLSCTLGATTRWHSLCTCMYIYACIILAQELYIGCNLKKLTEGHQPSPSASSMPPKQKLSVLLHEQPELLKLGLKFVRHGILQLYRYMLYIYICQPYIYSCITGIYMYYNYIYIYYTAIHTYIYILCIIYIYIFFCSNFV